RRVVGCGDPVGVSGGRRHHQGGPGTAGAKGGDAARVGGGQRGRLRLVSHQGAAGCIETVGEGDGGAAAQVDGRAGVVGYGRHVGAVGGGVQSGEGQRLGAAEGIRATALHVLVLVHQGDRQRVGDAGRRGGRGGDEAVGAGGGRRHRQTGARP